MGSTGNLQGLWRRLLLPLAAALLVILSAEGFVFARFRPNLIDRSGWLLHDPYKGESFDRIEVREKLRNLEDSEPDIISVGDSSGFFSVQPTIVNRYLRGFKYVNLSTGANHAYEGYRAMAEYMLQHSHHIKYVMLYIFPQLLPSDEVLAQGDLGTILYKNTIGPQSYASPPSDAMSPYAKAVFFEHRSFSATEPLTNHAGALQFISTARESLGWLPEFDVRFPRLSAKVGFYPPERRAWYYRLGLTETSEIKATLGDLKRMVNKYDAQLVIAFAPFPRNSQIPYDPNIVKAEEHLAAFQKENPDVKFLFPLVTAFGSEKFGMFNHISREYTFLSSERIGKALGQLIADQGSISPFEPHYHGTNPQPKVLFSEAGQPDAQALKAALALYLFANTADESYWNLLSKRVRDALGRSAAFQYMMEDTRTRIADLRSKGIELGYDTSNLVARPVEMQGMVHCDAPPDLRWYQISGTITFTYSSRTASSKEPVAWPTSSEIFVPEVVENGALKFDGYCEEPSMNEGGR